METSEFDAFEEVLRPVAKGFGEPFNSDRVKYYFAALSAYPIDAVRAAILATANQPGRKFFPKPGEIIATIVGDPETCAELAWSRFNLAIRHVGPDSPVTFGDPAIHATVEALGGWRDVNLWDALPVDEQTSRGFQFRRLFTHYLAHPDPAAPEVLNAEAGALTGNPLRVLDAKGRPSPLEAKALPPAEDQPKFDPVGAAVALESLAVKVNRAMTRPAPDPARVAAARALGPGDKPLDVEPTAEEEAELERRRQIARKQATRL